MLEIVLDIETVPDSRPEAFNLILSDTLANFKAPSGLTKEQAAIDLGLTDKDEIKFTSKDAMIARWEKELAPVKAHDVAMETYRKTALNGSQGAVCVIGMAFGDSAPIAFYDSNEADLLRKAFDMLDMMTKVTNTARHEVKWIGHNIEAFDLRFLYQRAVINGVKPPIPLIYSKYNDHLFDTMTAWAGFGNRISLDNLCKALGIESPKTDIDGSKVYDYVLAGKIEEVAEYCKKDVAATREAYRRMTFQIEPEEYF